MAEEALRNWAQPALWPHFPSDPTRHLNCLQLHGESLCLMPAEHCLLCIPQWDTPSFVYFAPPSRTQHRYPLFQGAFSDPSSVPSSYLEHVYLHGNNKHTVLE